MIEMIIKQTYPITKKEKCCAIYKAKMDAKREALRQRLMNDRPGKEIISERECEAEPQVREGALS
jgi:hypothetical protein